VDQKKTDPARYTLNMALAAVAGQVGCLTVVIVVAAAFGGLWLDGQFGTRPLFIIGLLLAAVPVTLIAMFWLVRQTTSRIQFENGKTNGKSRDDRDTDD
jgi:F0F1-type ATP synthase assembly protein I